MSLALFDFMLPSVPTAFSLMPRLGASELSQTDTVYLLKMDLPGVTGDDLKVQVKDHGHLLTVSGERKSTCPHSRSYGKFSRSFRLNDDADSEHLTAELVDGVLTVSVPKKELSVPEVLDVPVSYGGGVTLTTSEHTPMDTSEVESEHTPMDTADSPTPTPPSTPTPDGECLSESPVHVSMDTSGDVVEESSLRRRSTRLRRQNSCNQ